MQCWGKAVNHGGQRTRTDGIIEQVEEGCRTWRKVAGRTHMSSRWLIIDWEKSLTDTKCWFQDSIISRLLQRSVSPAHLSPIFANSSFMDTHTLTLSSLFLYSRFVSSSSSLSLLFFSFLPRTLLFCLKYFFSSIPFSSHFFYSSPLLSLFFCSFSPFSPSHPFVIFFISILHFSLSFLVSIFFV